MSSSRTSAGTAPSITGSASKEISGKILLDHHFLPRETPHRKDSLLLFYTGVVQIQQGLEDATFWISLIDSGTFEALVGILGDGHLCGFEQEELINWQVQSDIYIAEVLAYVHAAISTLATCLGLFVDYLELPAAQKMPAIEQRMLECTNAWFTISPRVWKSIWEVRTPVIDWRPEPRVANSIHETLRLALFQTVSVDNICYDGLRPLHPALQPNPGYMLHVAYALWVIGTPIKFNRPLLLFRLWDTLLRSHPDVDNKGFPEFYYEAVTGSIGPDRLARAYARDFRLVHQSQAVAQSTLRVIFSLRPARTPVFPMETRLEREVVFRSIAACRTLLCTPNEPDLPAFRSHFEMEASYLLGAQMSRPLPELQSHQVLLLVNKFLIIAMEHNDVGYVSFCVKLIVHCRRSFEDGKREAPGDELPRLSPLTAVRCHSAALWQKTMDVLRARTYIRNPTWKQLVVSWTGLRPPLDAERYLAVQQEEGYDPRRAFPPLVRCGWSGCMCSVHEPLHPMKMCKRCRIVVYCSTACQTKDWMEGDHKLHCRDRR